MNFLNNLLACATCMPDPTSQVGKAASMTLVFMAIIVFLILGLFIKIIFNFARREREHLKAISEQ